MAHVILTFKQQRPSSPGTGQPLRHPRQRTTTHPGGARGETSATAARRRARVTCRVHVPRPERASHPSAHVPAGGRTAAGRGPATPRRGGRPSSTREGGKRRGPARPRADGERGRTKAAAERRAGRVRAAGWPPPDSARKNFLQAKHTHTHTHTHASLSPAEKGRKRRPATTAAGRAWPCHPIPIAGFHLARRASPAPEGTAGAYLLAN